MCRTCSRTRILLLAVVLSAIPLVMLVCRQYQSGISQSPVIPTLTVKTYLLPAGFAERRGHLLVSPVDQDKLWLLGGDTPAEFDPQTERWEELNSDLARFISDHGCQVVRDPFNPDVLWVNNFHAGLARYEFSARRLTVYPSVTTFENSGLPAIMPDRDRVWIGTTSGLYAYQRASDTIVNLGVLRGLWVNGIAEGRNKLWLGSRECLVYYPDQNRLMPVTELDSWPLKPIEHYWLCGGIKVFSGPTGTVIFDGEDQLAVDLPGVQLEKAWLGDNGTVWLKAGQPRTLFRYSIDERRMVKSWQSYSDYLSAEGMAETPDYLYFRYGQNVSGIGRFDFATGAVTVLPVPEIQSWLVERDIIWYVTAEGLTRFPLLANDEKFVTTDSIASDYARILAYDRIDPEKPIDMVALIKKLAADRPLVEGNFRNDGQAVHTLFRALRTQDTVTIRAVKDYLATNPPRGESELCLYVLATNPLLLGDPETARENYQRLRREFPGGRFIRQIRDEEAEKIEIAAREHKSIMNGRLGEDEKLWRLGNLFFQASCVSWNAGEVIYNMDYPFGLFKRLLERYPRSRWADNAELTMLLHYEGGVHEGGELSMACVAGYEKFIRRYPDSDSLPEAIMQIASHHGMYISMAMESYAKMNRHYHTAKKLYQEVDNRWPGSGYAREAQAWLAQLEQQYEQHAWELTVTSDRAVYSPGDTVTFTFCLKNMFRAPREISVLQGLPNFGIYLTRQTPECPEGAPVEEFKTDYTVNGRAADREPVMLAADGGSYRATQQLHQLVPSNNQDGSFGHYVIPDTGTFFVRGYFRDDAQVYTISAQEIQFTVR